MRDKKATGNDDIGTRGWFQTNDRTGNIRETGERFRYFVEITMIASKKKRKPIKCSRNRKISPSHI
jgi:hypothetical protein